MSNLTEIMKSTDIKAVTGERNAARVKIGIEQSNGESFTKRVNEILARHALFIKNDVYTKDQFEEQAKVIRDSIARALDHADLYLRIGDKIVATQMNTTDTTMKASAQPENVQQ
jgi:hypothetical protein